MNKKLIQEGYNFEVLYNWDSLQRIARNPKYKKLCEYLEFDKDGFAVKDFWGETLALEDKRRLLNDKWENFRRKAQEKYTELKRDDPTKAEEYLKGFPQERDEFLHNLSGEADTKIARQEKLLEHIRTKFGLVTPIQPDTIINKVHHPALFSSVPIFDRDPFAVSVVFRRLDQEEDEKIVLDPIQDGQFIIVEIDPAAHFKKQIVSGVKEFLDNYRGLIPPKGISASPCSLLADSEEALFFKIDLLADDKDILAVIRHEVKPSTDSRLHLEKRQECYQIWDKRTQLKRQPFKEIAEDHDISEDEAKRRFQKAWTLIFGTKYNRSLWWKLFPSEKTSPFIIPSSRIMRPGSDKFEDSFEPQIEANLSIDEDPYITILLSEIDKIWCTRCTNTECKKSSDIERFGYCPNTELHEHVLDSLPKLELDNSDRQYYLDQVRNK